MKPPKPGEPYPVPMSSICLPSRSVPGLTFTPSCSDSPGFGNGSKMGAKAFPGGEAQPGEDTWATLGSRKEEGGAR